MDNIFSSFQEKKWLQEIRDREKRCEEEINTDEYEVVYCAAASPLDYFENYRPIHMLGHDLYKQAMDLSARYGSVPIDDQLYDFYKLLHQIMALYSRMFEYPRNDYLYYFFIGPSPIEQYPVIVYKEDNNGTCYAFSKNKEVFKELPHDFQDNWELYDVKKIKKRYRG